MIPKIVTEPAWISPVSESEVLVINNLSLIEWKPNFTELSKKTGLGITTCWDTWEKIQKRAKVTIKIDYRGKQ